MRGSRRRFAYAMETAFLIDHEASGTASARRSPPQVSHFSFLVPCHKTGARLLRETTAQLRLRLLVASALLRYPRVGGGSSAQSVHPEAACGERDGSFEVYVGRSLHRHIVSNVIVRPTES